VLICIDNKEECNSFAGFCRFSRTNVYGVNVLQDTTTHLPVESVLDIAIGNVELVTLETFPPCRPWGFRVLTPNISSTLEILRSLLCRAWALPPCFRCHYCLWTAGVRGTKRGPRHSPFNIGWRLWVLGPLHKYQDCIYRTVPHFLLQLAISN
jgi:hypothetical protein